jgi:sugar phosphate permease
MLGLILAGEAVYMLPFHVARFFRPTVLDVFGLSNTELGTAHAIYGVIAMLSYFPGGPLADRFPARKLLATSLWTTAAGGLYMATAPGYLGSVVLWGFFGITSILLFWAALIRATRDWGGLDEQGRAFGLLDGGRGLLAALLASLGAALFGYLFPEGYAAASAADREEALRIIILAYSAVTAGTGIFIWFVLHDGHPSGQPDLEAWRPRVEDTWHHILRVVKLPAVWYAALIVLCAYVGFKAFDNFALYMVQGWGKSEVEAAGIVAIAAWMRPIAAVAAGLLGDRYLVSRMTVLSFALLMLTQLVFAFFVPRPGAEWLMVSNMLVSSLMIFGLRALYYALFEEAAIPAAVTGTAVGVVSVVGYTPDIFVSYVGGVLLDRSPGLAGHQHYFLFVAGFAALGLLVSVLLQRRLRRADRPASNKAVRGPQDSV